MDETDAEAFDRFVEKHWGDELRNKSVEVSAEPVEEKQKKRGRKPKKVEE